MTYALTRSKRKTCAIYIRGGAVEVRAPLRLPSAEIERFVASKAGWIAKKLEESAAAEAKRAAFSPGYGDTVRYRGGEYVIASRPGNRAGVDGAGFFMPPGLTPEQIKRACVGIYRRQAKTALDEKVRSLAASMGVSPNSVRITGAKTRWGSCSAKKNINFSWHLMMAADPVTDYVVVHELAHLKEMNHSARFWAEVERVLPDYRERKKELKKLQEKLREEDWE